MFPPFQQLEQEKHRLRCELEVMEEEYEQRITELQSDLSGTYKHMLEMNFEVLFIKNKHKLKIRAKDPADTYRNTLIGKFLKRPI